MNEAISLGDIIQNVTSRVKTNFGQRLIGELAQPVFADLKELAMKRLALDSDEAPVIEPQQNMPAKIISAFKTKFAWGDLLSVLGLALLTVQSKLFPIKSENPGFFEKTFRAAALGLTFGGSVSAMYGKMNHLDQRVALGDDYAESLLKQAELQGKKIFTTYDEVTKETLKAEAFNLDKILVYPAGVRESILERHEKNDIGGLLDGKPGTGKTAGVRCILGKWASRIEKQGFEAKIAELNLANFDEYLKDINRNQSDVMEFIQAGTNADGAGSGSLLQNQGILVLELLIRRIQKLKMQVDKHNQAHPEREQRLAVFVDEFDKIFDPRTLQGCDKARLKNLLLQFNEIFIGQEILLTSNKTLEDMMKELKKHLESGEAGSATEVWGPMYDRLAAKNKISIPDPGPSEQAEIVAGQMLKLYPGFINWQDLGISKPNTGSIELDRKVLAEPIKVITSEINAELNGRQLQYASEDLISMLVGRARDTRASLGLIPDVIWDNMTAQDKITKTGALIDRDMIKTTLLNKSRNMKMNYGDINSELAKGLISNYLKLEQVKSAFPEHKIPPVNNLSELHALLAKAYKPLVQGGRQLYVAQAPVLVAGEEYRHFIYQNTSSELHSMNSNAEFSIGYLSTKDPQKKFKVQKLDAAEMIACLSQEQELKDKPLSKLIGGLAGEIKKGLAEAKIDPSMLLSLLTQSSHSNKA